MTDLFLLSEAQMRRIEPFFPLSHGVPRVDNRREWVAVARCSARVRSAQDGLVAGPSYRSN
jgi:hypothetical protein